MRYVSLSLCSTGISSFLSYLWWCPISIFATLSPKVASWALLKLRWLHWSHGLVALKLYPTNCPARSAARVAAKPYTLTAAGSWKGNRKDTVLLIWRIFKYLINLILHELLQLKGYWTSFLLGGSVWSVVKVDRLGPKVWRNSTPEVDTEGSMMQEWCFPFTLWGSTWRSMAARRSSKGQRVAGNRNTSATSVMISWRHCANKIDVFALKAISSNRISDIVADDFRGRS